MLMQFFWRPSHYTVVEFSAISKIVQCDPISVQLSIGSTISQLISDDRKK